MKLSTVVETLWIKAAPHLTDEELERIAEADDEGSTALCLVEYLQDVLEPMACLAMADDNGGANTGSFRSSRDVSSLMLFIASTLNAIEAGMYAGRWARDMKFARAKGIESCVVQKNGGTK